MIILPLRARSIATLLLLACIAISAGYAVADSPRTAPRPAQGYPTTEAAVEALVAAVRAGNVARIGAMLGAGSADLIHSGDPVADQRARERFVASFDRHSKIDMQGDEKATLLIGEGEWPFAVPLVKSAGGWHFDASSGAKEFLDRRIGRNELAAIQVCLAYVDAQRDYALTAGASGGVHQYASKFASTPGKKDGLYWPTADGEPLSPLGSLVTQAHAEGYRKQPYHGYYYRILTAQGANAPGGAYDYVVRGRMIGGFALVAYPAKWGVSGVMTFIVSHDGRVYEKNLGPATATVAGRMRRFDPDSSWSEAKP
ncbi:MAG TPA: DUF2950 domain-containing protein [Casimicrobiaceae bacterium]|nr:DUF2950 domain-containing protein [Casimicrobiaceae bacterium]